MSVQTGQYDADAGAALAEVRHVTERALAAYPALRSWTALLGEGRANRGASGTASVRLRELADTERQLTALLTLTHDVAAIERSQAGVGLGRLLVIGETSTVALHLLEPLAHEVFAMNDRDKTSWRNVVADVRRTDQSRACLRP